MPSGGKFHHFLLRGPGRHYVLRRHLPYVYDFPAQPKIQDQDGDHTAMGSCNNSTLDLGDMQIAVFEDNEGVPMRLPGRLMPC